MATTTTQGLVDDGVRTIVVCGVTFDPLRVRTIKVKSKNVEVYRLDGEPMFSCRIEDDASEADLVGRLELLSARGMGVFRLVEGGCTLLLLHGMMGLYDPSPTGGDDDRDAVHRPSDVAYPPAPKPSSPPSLTVSFEGGTDMSLVFPNEKEKRLVANEISGIMRGSRNGIGRAVATVRGMSCQFLAYSAIILLAALMAIVFLFLHGPIMDDEGPH